MSATNGETKDPVLVVLQLTGGNDYMNTVVPYGDSLYRDYRPYVNIADDDVLALDNHIGFHPNMAPLRRHGGSGRSGRAGETAGDPRQAVGRRWAATPTDRQQ